MQLDELLDDLAKAKDIEAAAKLDVDDYKRRLRRAEQGLALATERATECRAAVHRIIEAQTHSAFDDEE